MPHLVPHRQLRLHGPENSPSLPRRLASLPELQSFLRGVARSRRAKCELVVQTDSPLSAIGFRDPSCLTSNKLKSCLMGTPWRMAVSLMTVPVASCSENATSRLFTETVMTLCLISSTVSISCHLSGFTSHPTPMVKDELITIHQMHIVHRKLLRVVKKA